MTHVRFYSVRPFILINFNKNQGVTSKNVEYIARAIHDVTENK